MSNTSELVFVPLPEMGHILSTVQLAKFILQRNQIISISIFILKFPNFTAKVNAYVESQLGNNPYPTRLTFLTFPALPNLPEKSTEYFPMVIDLHKPIVKKAIEDRVKDGFGKPIGFVFDMFCATMIDVANELGVASYVFFTSGANTLNLMMYAQSLVDDHDVDVLTEFSNPGFTAVVPGFNNPVTSKVIPSSFQVKSRFSELLLELARKYREMKGILVNTYLELETLPIQALLNNDTHKTPSIYPVGPLVELESKGGNAELVIEWLDRQPESSVVFLCFGSMGIFVEEQVKEIANGVERSGHRFLWSLRKPPPSGGSSEVSSKDDVFLEALPEGFIDRTNDRGKVIGWAPQITILAHPAIGGFVSHCGWNSTLESLWCGVPMATWPMYAEQQLNAFQLVKELELAVEISIDYKMDVFGTRKGNFLVTAVEIENAVKNLMSMDEKMKVKVKKKSDEGKKAIENGGSSYNSLGCFIEDVLSNIS